MSNRIFFILGSLFLTVSVCGQQAMIRGRVSDAATNAGLPFAAVVVVGTTTGTTTDENGFYSLSGLTPGFIRLQFRTLGYEEMTSPEVEVSQSRIVDLDMALLKTDMQLGEVTVTKSLFRKPEESPVSLRNIGISEIETSPGANRDISKVIQSFPGVQSTPAFRNDIIIRGGGPSESRFFLDGVEVPNINHFATQGASGGPVGIINADLLREANYYSGAFPASRGNALSGVFEFSQRDGNHERGKGQLSVGASEIAAMVDGPAGTNTTYIVSVRRSYLKFLFSLLELPFLPTFNDVQFKVKIKPDSRNEITLTGLGALDQFSLNTGIKQPDDQQKFILSTLPEYEQWSYTAGAVYKHFREKGYHTLVASRSHLNNTSLKYLDNDDSTEANKTLDYKSEEIENKFRYENRILDGDIRISFGANLDLVTYTNTTIQQRYDPQGTFQVNYHTRLNLVKTGFFGQASHQFLNGRLELSAGVRFDACNYSDDMNNPFDQFSPRLSGSYRLTPKWSLNFNSGRYCQLPAYPPMGFKRDGELVNKSNGLKYISADHVIAGVEFRPRPDTQLSVEGFLKNYHDYPFSIRDSVSLANLGADYGVIGNEEVVSASDGKAYGVEFQARITSGGKFNFNLSYTLVRSEFEDKHGRSIASSWDSKHLLTLTTTRDLNRNWRAGIRWRFVGGLPYTPYDMDRSSLIDAWNMNNGPYLDTGRWNSLRFDPFHQLDVRVDKVYYLQKFILKFYLDIQNLYHFQSQAKDHLIREQDSSGAFLTTDNGTRYVIRKAKNTTGTVLPTIGIIFGF